MVNNPFLDIISLILFSSGVLNLGVFFYLILNKTRLNNTAKFFLALSTISVSLWMFVSWIGHFSESIQITTFCARFSYGIVFWLILNLILFTQNYIRQQKLNLLITSLAVLVFSTTLLTDFIVLAEIPSTILIEEHSLFGSQFPQFFLTTLFLFLLLVASFFKTIKISTGIKRGKLILMMISFLITTSAVLVFNFYLPLLNNSYLTLIGQMASFVFAFTIGLIVLQEKIFSFKFLFVNSLVAFINGSFLSLIYLGISKFSAVLMSYSSSSSNMILDELSYIKIIIFIILALSFSGQYIGRLMSKTKKIVYKICGVSTEDLDETIKWLIDKTNKEIDLSLYLIQLLQKLEAQLFTSGIYLYLTKEKKFWGTGVSFSISEIPQKIKGRYLNQDSDENQKYALIYPLLMGQEILGYLFFEHKNNNGFFSLEEIRKINNLQKILSIAANRFSYYNRQKHFNKTLHSKIDFATTQLKNKNEKLTETLRFERDMFDILGHELRTPLSIARNAIYINEDLLNVSSPNIAKIREYNSTALRNSQKEINLINTLLSATKIDNNKLDLNPDKIDLVDIVQNSLADFQNKATEKGLKIVLNTPKKALVFADTSRTHEITDNLIDNAIKYTSGGVIQISIKPFNNKVVFSVKDSGKGIPKKCIPNLGKKFYRVDNYVDSNSNFNIVRPGGTGLGLFVTYGLAKAMNCKINVLSAENHGSKFSVSFPTSG